MTNEQSFFLQILSDHLNGRATTANENIDWAAVMTLAQNHQVNGIVYWQCKEFLPDEVGERLRKKYFSELYYYYNREALNKQVEQALNEAQIPFFPVKGLAVSHLYPIPALRTMGDCDIVVHPEDKEKAHAIMVGLGFDILSKGLKEWVYSKNKMVFEIHDHLLYNEPGNTESSRTLFDVAAWENVATTDDGLCYELDWNFHFLFLLLHLKKHIIHSGIGFRQFMDLSVVLQHCDLDWIWIKNIFDKLELLYFLQVCLAILKRWFMITPPIETADLDDTFYEDAAEKIIANGVFGFDDRTNIGNTAISILARHCGPLWYVRIKMLFSNAFPSYRYMRCVPYYAFLNQRPWLLPVAWIYRFYRSLRYHMASKGKQMLKSALISNKKLDSRMEKLARWGL